MSYKYELHCHTGEVSTCADAPAAQIVERYKKAGYDGIVITDHFSGMTFSPFNYFNPQKNAEHYLKGYREALKAAGDDFTVLLGMEIRFFLTRNDYLVYGVTEDFLRLNGDLMAKNLKDYGWEYVVCDIQWSEPTAKSFYYNYFAPLCMDGFGRLMPAENRFPSCFFPRNPS